MAEHRLVAGVQQRRALTNVGVTFLDSSDVDPRQQLRNLASMNGPLDDVVGDERERLLSGDNVAIGAQEMFQRAVHVDDAR